MSQGWQACTSGDRQQSPPILEFRPQYGGLARLPHRIIRYNLSGVVNRRVVGGGTANFGDFHFTLVLVETSL
jgi:hypothetical protein